MDDRRRRPLDTTKYFVVAPSMFANGLSSSPSNTPAPYDRGRFPAITIQDNVRAQHRLLTENFGVKRIQLAIGGSMGAFQAYQWGLALPRPGRADRAMLRRGPRQPALLRVPRGRQGGAYRRPGLQGRATTAPRPQTGCARMGRVWAGWALSQQFYRDGLYRQHGLRRRRGLPRRLLGGVLAEARRQQPA